MSTLPRAPAVPKPLTKPSPRPHPRRSLMAIWIPNAKGELIAYTVTVLTADPNYGLLKIYRVKAAGSEIGYDVCLNSRGEVECECGDFLWRRDGQDEAGCKHIQALRDFGMLPALPAKPAFRSAADRARNDPGSTDGLYPDDSDWDAPTSDEVNEMLAGRPPESEPAWPDHINACETGDASGECMPFGTVDMAEIVLIDLDGQG